jgi:HIV-1 Vpr-binding protein
MKDQEGHDHFAQLPDVLKLICALAAHRKFAALFVDRGGIQKILSIPRITPTYMGLSACLFTFGSLQVDTTILVHAILMLICYFSTMLIF